MTEPRLFPDDPPDKPPHNGTDASKLTAETMQPFIGLQRERVLQFIQQCGPNGATDEEIQDALKIRGDSERPHRKRLVEWRRIRDSGNLRMTHSGRPATVWIAAESPALPPANDTTNNSTDSEKSNGGRGELC